jgi:hypothetical protein
MLEPVTVSIGFSQPAGCPNVDGCLISTPYERSHGTLHVPRFRVFNEDVRVELEIRIADEERVTRGYATLLAVPGAIASAPADMLPRWWYPEVKK